MKKGFSYFLIVYLLTLTLMPCPDQVVQEGTVMHGMINQGQHGNDNDHADCCSPLCTCSCCSLSFETAKIFIVSQAFPLPIESNYHFSIWEPPKA
jgi:hypothetical protein